MKYIMIHKDALKDTDQTVESHVSSLCNTPEECLEQLKNYNIALEDYEILAVISKAPIIPPKQIVVGNFKAI